MAVGVGHPVGAKRGTTTQMRRVDFFDIFGLRVDCRFDFDGRRVSTPCGQQGARAWRCDDGITRPFARTPIFGLRVF